MIQIIDWLFLIGIASLLICVIVAPWISQKLFQRLVIGLIGYICFSGILTISYHIAKVMM